MAKTKVLARNWLIEVNTGTSAVPVWTPVKGINTFTISGDKEDTDTTDFDSNGWAEHLVAGRSKEVTFEGFFIEDEADGTRDPGQQYIEGQGEKIGLEAVTPLRLTSPGGKVRQFNGSFAVGDVGGGNNDATSWGATYTPTGAPIAVVA